MSKIPSLDTGSSEAKEAPTGSNRPTSARKSKLSANGNTSRPVSARSSKSKRNLNDEAKWTRMMTALKTPKEKELAKTCQVLRMKVNSKDNEIKKLESRVKKMEIELKKYQQEQQKKSKKIDQERKLRTAAVKEEQHIRAVMQKIQSAVTARMKMLGIDFSNINSIGEALDASLKAINKLVAELEAKDKIIDKLTKENAQLKATIEEQKNELANLRNELAKKNKIIDKQSAQISEQNSQIAKLTDDNARLNDENSRLKNELEALKNEYDQYKKKAEAEISDLKKKIEVHEVDKIAKDDRIKVLEQRIADLEAQNEDQRNTINDQSKRIKELEAMVEDRDGRIKALMDEIEQLKAEVDRLTAIINKPKEEIAAQTEISGAIDKQLSDYPRLLKEIVALRNKLERKNQIIADLQEENRQLLKDIEWLLKKAAKFYPDKSPHTGVVGELRASPNEMIVATGATDQTVRLWKINPDAEDKNKKAFTYQRSIIDGEVHALAWSKDGKLLAGGTGFRDGPEGFLVIWCMVGDRKYEVDHAIRSRPTIRFGRIRCLEFSNDNKFVFAGDTKGSIWAISIDNERIVSHFDCHNDIVYDLSINSSHQLYSVSHQGTLAVIILPKECNGPGTSNDDEKKDDDGTPKLTPTNSAKKKKKDKKGNKSNSKHAKSKSRKINLPRNIGTPTRQSLQLSPNGSNKVSSRISAAFQPKKQLTVKDLLEEKDEYAFTEHSGITLERDTKYPFWRVSITDDNNNKIVCCASRKVRVFNILDDGKIEEKVKVMDDDMDHVKSLHIKNGMLLTSRQLCGRVKLFDLKTGKQIAKFNSKKPIAQTDFMSDNKTICALQQEFDKNSKGVNVGKTPSMKLFTIKNQK
mmetsp:Transcript_78946/g.96515  ORF Transcript_78946/g.96515 Transcript_78946/m.96515 type:complete len:864 (-) Transcript_78946:84-2675(-)